MSLQTFEGFHWHYFHKSIFTAGVQFSFFGGGGGGWRASLFLEGDHTEETLLACFQYLAF